MALIESIRDIKAAIRPKLKHVQLRVYINGKQEQFPTKVKVTAIDPKNMDVTEPPIHHYAQHLYGCAMHSETPNQCRNAYKLAIELELDASVNYDTSNIYTVCDKFRNENKRNFSSGYLRQYKTLVTVLKGFKPNRIITVQDITTDFITNFIYHLTEGDKDRSRVVNGTVNTYLKNLKRILRYAKDDLNITTSNPKFPRAGTILKDNEHGVIKLTWDELIQLENVEVQSDIESRTLQCFLFMCYTGVRISDFQYISVDGLTGNILQFHIQKQNKDHTIVLDPKPLRILKQVKSFNPPSQQKMNYHIKKLCERAEINNEITYYKSVGNKTEIFKVPKHKKISVHKARSTYISIVYNHSKDIVAVSKEVGHSDTKVTLRYCDPDASTLKGIFKD